jgi:hopene-associated glycosyltransferase HpnB
MTPLFVGLVIVAALAWTGVWWHPARPWDFEPRDSRPLAEKEPEIWPRVAVLVPARNEAESLPQTLPLLLAQDYPGEFHVVVMDDRSQDGTAEVAQKLASGAGVPERLKVFTGLPLPQGWMGKVWALQQGAEHAIREWPDVAYFLLTDADIAHTPDSLRRLVMESTAEGIGLNSRMARLRCESFWEKLLIPPFVFFFILLYPTRWVNRRDHFIAGAAGGCVLLERTLWEKFPGGFGVIRNAVIDDCSLARAARDQGAHLCLTLSETQVVSLRPYPKLEDIWKMVARSAFAQLHHSYLLLAGCVLFLAALFLGPEVALVLGCAGWLPGSVLALALGVILVRWWVYQPAASFFRVPGLFRFTLPLAGVLYGAMTASSAWRHARGRGPGWRELNLPEKSGTLPS